MAQFHTKADLEFAVGGAAILLQLLDKDQDQVADDPLVTACIEEGSNELASYIQAQVDLNALRPPYPGVLITKSADASAFHAWSRGSDGQAAPPNVVQRYEAAIAWAKDVGLRRATLGVVPKAALDPPVEMIVSDPLGQGISVEGFKRGFR